MMNPTFHALAAADLASVTGGAGVGARAGGAVGAVVGRAAGSLAGCPAGAINGVRSSLAGPEEDGNLVQRAGAAVARAAGDAAAGCVNGAAWFGAAGAGAGARNGAAVGNALTLGR